MYKPIELELIYMYMYHTISAAAIRVVRIYFVGTVLHVIDPTPLFDLQPRPIPLGSGLLSFEFPTNCNSPCLFQKNCNALL